MLRQALLTLACSGCISSSRSLFQVSEFSVSACGYRSDSADLAFFRGIIYSGLHGLEVKHNETSCNFTKRDDPKYLFCTPRVLKELDRVDYDDNHYLDFRELSLFYFIQCPEREYYLTEWKD